MVVILDERYMERRKVGGKVAGIDLDLQISRMAELVVIIKDETYELVKDRYTGYEGEYPLDELPELIKQRLILQLKARDNVSTDECS